MGYIYYIQNQVNKKGYVGQTVRTINQRWVKHKQDAGRGKDGALGAAIRKYSPDAFIVEQVCQADDLLLDDLEIYYIAKFGTYASLGRGYNLNLGGGSNRGWVPSEEFRAKMSAMNTGKKFSEETKSKMSSAKKGKKTSSCSEETKAKIAASLKGKKVSKETRIKLSAAHKGRKLTEKWKANISAAKRG